MKTRLRILVCGGCDFHNVSLVYNTLNDIALAWDEVCIITISSHPRGIAGDLAEDWASDLGQPSLEVYNMFDNDIFNWLSIDLVLSFDQQGATGDIVRKAKELGLWVKEVKDKSDD